MLPTFPFSPDSAEYGRRRSWMHKSLEFFRSYKGGKYIGMMSHVELFAGRSSGRSSPIEVTCVRPTK